MAKVTAGRDQLGEFAPEFAHLNDDVLFGEVWAREDKLSGWSFGFRSLKDSWVPQENGIRKRNLEDIDLVEVSILDVTPAYPATSIETRDGKEDLLEFRNVQEEIELDIEKRAENQEKTEPQSKKVDMNQLKREFEFVNLGGKR